MFLRRLLWVFGYAYRQQTHVNSNRCIYCLKRARLHDRHSNPFACRCAPSALRKSQRPRLKCYYTGAVGKSRLSRDPILLDGYRPLETLNESALHAVPMATAIYLHLEDYDQALSKNRL